MNKVERMESLNGTLILSSRTLNSYPFDLRSFTTMVKSGGQGVININPLFYKGLRKRV